MRTLLVRLLVSSGYFGSSHTVERKIATDFFRLLSAGKLFEAIDEATEAIKTAGYDANNLPQDLIDTLPSSLSDLRRLEEKASGPPLENPTEEDELAAVRLFIMNLSSPL